MLTKKQILSVQNPLFGQFKPKKHHNVERFLKHIFKSQPLSTKIQKNGKKAILLRGGLEELETDDDARIASSHEKNFKWLFDINDQPEVYGLLEYQEFDELSSDKAENYSKMVNFSKANFSICEQFLTS